jgi:hypothetical protein
LWILQEFFVDPLGTDFVNFGESPSARLKIPAGDHTHPQQTHKTAKTGKTDKGDNPSGFLLLGAAAVSKRHKKRSPIHSFFGSFGSRLFPHAFSGSKFRNLEL